MAVTTKTQSTAMPLLKDRRRMLLWGLLALMLVAGWGLRLYYITDPPLDFHPQRQYWDANRARFMYYSVLKHFSPVPEWKMEIAKGNADISTEPPIVESLAVAGYLLTGGESLAIPRGIVATLYVIGGLFLFLLASRLFSAFPAFVALGYYLFLPFAVQSTRTFQPDPLMVMLMTTSLYFLYRYTEEQTLKRLITAGVFTMLALLAKPTSVLFVIIPFALLIIAKLVRETKGFRRLETCRRVFPPIHVIIFCGVVLLGLSWTIWNLLQGGGVAQQAAKTHMPQLFHNPLWWKGYWIMIWGGALQYWALVFGLLGIVVECIRWTRDRSRFAIWLILGSWIGYTVYFYAFNYHVQSHIYYNLPMVPIVALSVAALVSAAAEWIFTSKPVRWLVISGWVGYLIVLFFIQLPAVLRVPQPSELEQPNPVAMLFSSAAVPIFALTLGASIAIIIMQLRARARTFHDTAGILAGITLAILLIGTLNGVAGMQAQAHPRLAMIQKTLETIGERVSHTRKAVFFTYGYGDPLKYHGIMGGHWWPTQADFAAERMRGERQKSTVERLQTFINMGDELFIIEWTQFMEFQQQPELMQLLADNYPILWQPTNPEAPDENSYFIFDLTHPRQPLPMQ
ncbi:MAG: ArnT family glycosyltransferase [Armatimonadota bacterium]